MAGMLGGFLGIGGGILLMPILRFGVGMEPACAAGTCMAAVFFTTLGGSIKHFKLGHIDFISILPVIITGLVSTIIFSILFVHIAHKHTWLDVATGIVFSLVAFRMLWEGISGYTGKASERDNGSGIRGSIFAGTAIGAAAGVLPGLLGIGTGAVLVPAFAFALNAPIKIAIGSSLACFSMNALASSAFKLSQGFIQMHTLIPLCIGTFIGSRFGAALNGRSSSILLKFAFGMVFFSVACRYLFLAGGF
jgi:uncharacterized membrane protein YfcA